MGGCKCITPSPSSKGTVSGDTHAASLTGAVTNKSPQEGNETAASDITSAKFTASNSPGAGERAFTNNANKSITTSADTKAVVITVYWHVKTTVGMTHTITVRKGTAPSSIDFTGTTILGSETSASSAEEVMSFTVVDTSPGTSNQVYNVTQSHGSAPSTQHVVMVTYTAIDDTHAASLTGSSGTCV